MRKNNSMQLTKILRSLVLTLHLITQPVLGTTLNIYQQEEHSLSDDDEEAVTDIVLSSRIDAARMTLIPLLIFVLYSLSQTIVETMHQQPLLQEF